jgi:hypothetical protein
MDADSHNTGYWKDKFKKLEAELMAEIRDPCGTIWEHTKKLQNEIDMHKASYKYQFDRAEAAEKEIKRLKKDLQGLRDRYASATKEGCINEKDALFRAIYIAPKL